MVIYNWESDGVCYMMALSNAKIVYQRWQMNDMYVGSISEMMSTDWPTN